MNIETAKRLYEYRKAHGYSQEELAAKIGVSRQAISKWERSESSPDTDNLIALAKLYGISLDTLLMGEDEPKKDNAAENNNAEESSAQNNNESEQTADSEKENTKSFGNDYSATNTPATEPPVTISDYSNTANGAGYNNYGAQTSFQNHTAKKKLSGSTKLTIGIIIGVVIIIIAAAAGFNIYEEIAEERREAQQGQIVTQTTTTVNSAGQANGQASGQQPAASSQGVYSVDAAAVNKISVEWAAGNVNVSYYDGNQIQFSDGLDQNDSNALMSRTEGSDLKIYFCQNYRGGGNQNAKDLQINIPNGMTLTEFDIESTLANITVNGIIADSAELHTNSGEITGSGEFASLDVETNSSNAQITNSAALIRQIDANTRSGNITVTVPQNIGGFYLEYETVSGAINTDFSTQSSGTSRNGILNYGNSSTQIEVETTSGSFSLKAAQ